MSQAETLVWGKALLLKIHVITGWTIPEKELLTILIDQFQKKLIESYPDMNVEEIEFAFRQSGTTVKDWGKAMNLSLIDEVLIPYLDERKRLSHELEERKIVEPQKLYTDEDNDNLVRQDIEAFFQRCLSGVVPHTTPVYFKDILVKDGLMKEDESLPNFFVQKIGSGAKNIYTKG